MNEKLYLLVPETQSTDSKQFFTLTETLHCSYIYVQIIYDKNISTSLLFFLIAPHFFYQYICNNTINQTLQVITFIGSEFKPYSNYGVLHCVQNIVNIFVGTDRFYKDIELMIGFRPSPIWHYMWKYITPSIILVMVSSLLFQLKKIKKTNKYFIYLYK